MAWLPGKLAGTQAQRGVGGHLAAAGREECKASVIDGAVDDMTAFAGRDGGQAAVLGDTAALEKKGRFGSYLDAEAGDDEDV